MNRAGVRIAMAVLAVVLAPALASAEGAAEQKAQPAGPVTIKIFRTNPGPAYLKQLDDMMALKKVEEKLNVDLKYIHPTDENAELNIVIASGDYPDVFEETTWTYYAGGIQKAFSDGIIIRVNELIAKKAPNIQKILDKDARYRKETMNDSGDMLGIKRYEPGFIERPYSGFYVRQDWLDKLGRKAPSTIQEWYETLKDMKGRDLNGDGKPVQYPFAGAKDRNFKKFSTAWGVLQEGFGKDPASGKVVFSPVQPAYRDFLVEMGKWLKEGLLNPDSLVTDINVLQSDMSAGRGGAMYNTNTRAALWEQAGQKSIGKLLFSAVAYPVGPSGKRYAGSNFDLVTQDFNHVDAISSKNKNLDKTMEVFDYFYSAEGSDLLNWGIEGQTFAVKNGVREYTIPYLEKGKWVFSDWGNPRVMDVKAALAAYTPHMMDWNKTWYDGSDYGLFLPASYTNTDAEAKRLAALMADINTLTQETVDKILLGALPMTAWDEYVSKAKKMGVDEAVSIVQAAVDRFNNRK